MLKKLIGRMVRKHGMAGLLVKIGDWAVKQSKGKDDDQVWNDVVKPFIKENF
jgi:hypothetical protein|tara:strand:- start:3843 stop:3998 length:156 start_codon:yes stop_codon:yes gene_type:complete